MPNLNLDVFNTSRTPNLSAAFPCLYRFRSKIPPFKIPKWEVVTKLNHQKYNRNAIISLYTVLNLPVALAFG
jgi:hypothetical protein